MATGLSGRNNANGATAPLGEYYKQNACLGETNYPPSFFDCFIAVKLC